MLRKLSSALIASCLAEGTTTFAAAPARAAEVWECHGNALEPTLVQDSEGLHIYFSGYSQCLGTFHAQRVCVKLQRHWPIPFEPWEDRGGFHCSPMTANIFFHYGYTYPCDKKDPADFRTVSFGIAHYETHSEPRTSDQVHLVC